MNFCKGKVIVSYIAKSIRNEYIRLSRIKSRRAINETELNLDLEIAYECGDLEFELLDTFRLLTKKETYIMKLIYIYCLSTLEISQCMNISR
ncbi:MAG: sigma-70 family RNA polymerase sigma factor [Clostridium sartagoforme]|nr:sigma-70 family RNA polymerase sigma factor [Clostridium sartagoforme]